jgi:uncharacterized membrane protein YedE/YeeE
MPGSAAALGAGTLFGIGLVVSQMIDPGKVLAFLDIAGRWDPSLALVMAAALAVAIPGFRLTAARRAPMFGGSFDQPRQRPIDGRLLAGAAVFGTGWGLVGFCPGPAIAALAFGKWQALVFVLAMLTGAAAFHLGPRRRVPAIP